MRRAVRPLSRIEPASRSAATRTLVLALLTLLAGCASTPEAETDPPAGTAATEAALAEEGDSTSAEVLGCVREATVTVRVDNKSSYDIQVRFGSYRPSRVALGFSRTTYQIARYHLERSVELVILRGGRQLGGPAVIPTEPVFCNSATLVIGGSPEYSIFYGDFLREPVRGDMDEEAEAEDAAAADPAPADSTTTDAGG